MKTTTRLFPAQPAQLLPRRLLRLLLRLLPLCLALLLCAGLALPAAANETNAAPAEGDLQLISYNIAGLPFLDLLGISDRDPKADAAQIGSQIAQTDYALLAVQEDFSNYKQLRDALQAPHYTFHKGNIPAGDGLDLFSRYPLYNVQRVAWGSIYGGITYGAMDEYTPKGFLYAVMELAPGVYVDVYNLHANANDPADWSLPWNQETASGRTRRSEFEQLSAFITAHSAGRAIIILGDFNTTFRKVPDGLYEVLVQPHGLQDSWAQLNNNGVMEYNGGAWPGGDTIDRVLFRSSNTVDFTVTQAGSKGWFNPEGVSLSDHYSWTATLHYTVIGNENPPGSLQAPREICFLTKGWSYVKGIAHAFVLLFKELPALIEMGIQSRG